MTGWTCATCGRTFAHAKQNHACKPSLTVDQHFVGKPAALREAFERIANALKETGELHVDAVATNIHLGAQSNFASAKAMASKLRIEFLLDKPLSSDRIVKSERFSPTRYAHHVDLLGPGDVDPELIGWLRAAQKLRS